MQDGEADNTVQTAAADVEEQQRKRALDIIKKAVRNSIIPLNNREASHRLLPGLWSATVSILLACLDVKDVMRLMSSRAAALPFHAENAASPPVSFTPQQLARYVKEVAVAQQAIAETIGECIPQLQREGLEDRLPESVLDCAVFLLVISWGPVHLRRAMTEQVAAFVNGRAAPAVFLEPVDMLRRHEEEHRSAEPEEDPAELPRPLPERGEKLIRVFTDYRLEGDAAEWAFAIHKSGPGNNDEMHVMKGESTDANGRSAPLVAIVEALKALSHENGKSAIIVETCHDFVLKGMEGKGQERLAFRHPEEDSLWSEFDALSRGRDLRFRAVQSNLSDRLQHVCDMVMKRGAGNAF